MPPSSTSKQTQRLAAGDIYISSSPNDEESPTCVAITQAVLAAQLIPIVTPPRAALTASLERVSPNMTASRLVIIDFTGAPLAAYFELGVAQRCRSQ